jgi:threonine dehydrogenase-like Zn-dependent dehydrogenase
MQAIWLENQKLQLKTDLPLPEIPPGEVLIKVLRAGICNTDLELLRGYYPYTGILGHEFVGMVEKGADHLIGKRVVGEINASCGKCEFCLKNIPTHCENRTVLGIVNRHGVFAEYVTLPEKNLHIIPDNIPTDFATFVEPIAAALEIQSQVEITEKHQVLVVGDGKLGQLVAQTLALTGCDLLVVGRHREKLANLTSRGIKTNLGENVKNRSFDIAVECTGNESGFTVALNALKPRGILVLKSTYAGKLTVDASAIVVDEITVIGSRCGNFTPAIKLLEDHKIDVANLITDKYDLKDGLKAFGHAQKKGVLKILLNMEKGFS